MTPSFLSGSPGNERRIIAGRLEFLRALRSSPDRSGTLDDSTEPERLVGPFDDGGKWRGHVPKGLDHILVSVGADRSRRKSRNGGLLHRWRATSDAALDEAIADIETRLAALDAPAVTRQQLLF